MGEGQITQLHEGKYPSCLINLQNTASVDPVKVGIIQTIYTPKTDLNNEALSPPTSDSYKAKIVNFIDQALQEGCNILTLPEISTWPGIEMIVIDKLKQLPSNRIVIAGSYYKNRENIAPIIYKVNGETGVRYQGKKHPAKAEMRSMRSRDELNIFINTGLGDLAVVICYDATNWELFNYLEGLVDWVVVIANNRAKERFRNMLINVCRHHYYYILYCNDGKFGYSSLFVPLRCTREVPTEPIPPNCEQLQTYTCSINALDLGRRRQRAVFINKSFADRPAGITEGRYEHPEQRQVAYFHNIIKIKNWIFEPAKIKKIAELAQALNLFKTQYSTDSQSQIPELLLTPEVHKIVMQFYESYRKRLDKQEDSIDILNELVTLLIAIGRSDEAKQLLQTVNTANLAPEKQSLVVYNSFRACLEEPNFGEAFRIYQKLLQLNHEYYRLFNETEYRPKKIIGVGGFGVLFLCNSPIWGDVVVKAIISSVKQADIVINEASNLRQCESPFIIKLINAGYQDWENKEKPFVVMEFFDGQDLESYIDSHGSFTVGEGLRIARSIAEGLKNAHEHNIVHRDIKPANILYRKTSIGFELKIIDFGLAMPTEKIESMGLIEDVFHKPTTAQKKSCLAKSIIGTRQYAPPEQQGHSKYSGWSVNKYSDVYAFGRTLLKIFFDSLEITESPEEEYAFREIIELIEICTREAPEERLQNFSDVIAIIQKLQDKIPDLERDQYHHLLGKQNFQHGDPSTVYVNGQAISGRVVAYKFNTYEIAIGNSKYKALMKEEEALSVAGKSPATLYPKEWHCRFKIISLQEGHIFVSHKEYAKQEFPVDSTVDGTILDINENGIYVLLPGGIFGLIQESKIL